MRQEKRTKREYEEGKKIGKERNLNERPTTPNRLQSPFSISFSLFFLVLLLFWLCLCCCFFLFFPLLYFSFRPCPLSLFPLLPPCSSSVFSLDGLRQGGGSHSQIWSVGHSVARFRYRPNYHWMSLQETVSSRPYVSSLFVAANSCQTHLFSVFCFIHP